MHVKDIIILKQRHQSTNLQTISWDVAQPYTFIGLISLPACGSIHLNVEDYNTKRILTQYELNKMAVSLDFNFIFE